MAERIYTDTNPIYPFSAIVGQDQLKLALILNAINPKVGGVLIRGEKGTAKSTTVRAMAALLPKIAVVKGCPYNCNPDQPQHLCSLCRKGRIEVMYRSIQVVTLPLNATEDRVVGGIDFSRAVKKGIKFVEPGILAKAHRGILYVDEVNLLDDHVVDIILDSAASGQNVIEREGISLSHASRFVLVGTMNPEEGELRPQLLDRFGLCVEVGAIVDRDDRVMLMERREAYDISPLDFIMQFDAEDKRIAGEIVRARKILKEVYMPKRLRSLASQLAIENNVAGHRADLIIEQAAKALAALKGHHEVTTGDVLEIAPLVLSHRRRNSAPPPPPEKHDQDHETPPEDNQEETHDHNRHQKEGQQEGGRPTRHQSDKGTPQEGSEEEESYNQRKGRGRQEGSLEQVFPVGETFKVKRFTAPKDRLFRRGSGRRSRTRSARKQGRYVKSTSSRNTGDVAFDATLRAAAPYQSQRRNEGGLAVVIRPGDVREKIREKRVGNFLLFVVDASGSMGARGRMIASKGAIMSLLLDAYQKRDRVAMISFRRDKAIVNLPPTSSIELAARYLSEMPVGGKTPLSAGLARSYEVLQNYLVRDPSARPIVLIVTDGRSNVAIGEKDPLEEALGLAKRMAMDERVRFIVVDTEGPGLIRFGLARKLALALNAQHFKIEDLRADTLLNIAKENIR